MLKISLSNHQIVIYISLTFILISKFVTGVRKYTREDVIKFR